MNKYKVIKKEGVRTIAGDLKKKGETFLGSPRSATIQLQVRCKEIEEVKAEPVEVPPAKEPKEPKPKEPAPKDTSKEAPPKEVAPKK